jgi:hypothetical protein
MRPFPSIRLVRRGSAPAAARPARDATPDGGVESDAGGDADRER